VTAAKGEAGETVVLTGHVRAEDEPALAFRIGGRMIERPVNVGDRVEAGQVLAKLDPENELNALRSAESALAAAQGQLTYARGDFERQRQLLANGHTPRARFDLSQKALQNRAISGRQCGDSATDCKRPRQLDSPDRRCHGNSHRQRGGTG
jgi:membrane fusion protein, multidrug efflux system